MISLSVLTKASGPANSMPLPSRNLTFTSGFLPGTAENSIVAKCSVMNVTGAIRLRSNGEIEQDTSTLGCLPGADGAWISTAKVSRPTAAVGWKIAFVALGHG